MIASWSRVDTLMAFFRVALTFAHAFNSTFVMLIGCSCKPVGKAYFISTTVVSQDGVYQGGAHCTLLKYSPSTTIDPAGIIQDIPSVFSWRVYGLLSHLTR